tara:strand:+ start:9 stop:557 length:549 start_codon:yes stop_codon:yes gene_type:complete
MKTFERFFFRLSDREQNLLVITIWFILLLGFYKISAHTVDQFDELENAEDNITMYSEYIKLKPGINQALEAQKLEQKNKSYDKKNLSNRASSLADQVFPQRDYRELDTEERERYSQHRVRIKFERASYEKVNQYANLIRQESPYMFLSEVKIEPNYPPKSRPYEPTTYDASFEVSSVEFLNP